MKHHKISFLDFKEYCLSIQKSLNQLQSYSAQYHISSNPLLKEHDGEYLKITFKDGIHFIKINLCFSIAYQIPTFYFMVYDSDSQPYSAQQIYQQIISNGQKNNQQLHPSNTQGIYLSQNPINRQYFYTLHHCDLTMKINYLIPFYLSLLGLHPPLLIQNK